MHTELSRRERKKEETRTRIFRAAIQLFRDRGFESTTVDEITEKADVAKGTFFNYFPRKESVLAYLSETRLIEIEENASVILATNKPVREKLVELYLDAASAYAEDKELSRFVLTDLMQRAFGPVEDVGSRWQKVTVQVIRHGQEKGELRRDVEPVRAESLLTSLYFATLYEWVCCPGETFDVEEELRARLHLALDGIAAR